MGLVKAFSGAVRSELSDQWKEFVYCPSLDNDTLVLRGTERRSADSSNQHASPNIITSGSKIVVNEGQCLLVVENGKIVDFSVEPGAYVYHSDTEPSLFDGGWKGLKESFKKVGHRFVYGGQPENDVRVYFVNTKEITGNKFGIGRVPFRDGEFGFTVLVKGYGIYSYRIQDPVLFYASLAANVEESFSREQLDEQLKAEFQHGLQAAIGKVSELKVAYDKIPLYTKELAQEVDTLLDTSWKASRGMTVENIGFASLAPEEESVAKISQFQEARVYSNPAILGGLLGSAQAEALRSAAANESGALNGFLGMGFAQRAGVGASPAEFIGAVAGASKDPETAWKCACGTANNGKFCSECGQPKTVAGAGCSHANATPDSRFCPDCGQKLK